MEENPELEEGEAGYHKDDDDIDPDIALSYIDEKIQHVLGHFQKDFEGGVSAENSGAKFGEYGSFLPAYERSLSMWSRPKTPPRNSSIQKSPNNYPLEGASQNLKAPPDVPPSLRLETVSHSGHSLVKSEMPSIDVSVKRDKRLSSAKMTAETSKNSGNSTDQRPLKVRIKVGSDKRSKKNAAIYSGLGLDNSPSSSLGNSPDGSGGTHPLLLKTGNESPTRILQEMTSLPLPANALISPLHDSLLCLIADENQVKYGKPVFSLKGSQENSVAIVGKSISCMDNRKLLKEKKTQLVGKRGKTAELKHANGINFDNKNTSLDEEKLQTETTGSKEDMFSDQRCTPSHTVCFADSIRASCRTSEFFTVTSRTSEVFRETNKDGARDGFLSCNSVKEDSLESNSGLDSGKTEKQSACGSFMKRRREQRVLNSCDDVALPLRDNSWYQGIKAATPSKDHSEVSKCKEDFGAVPLPDQMFGQIATSHPHDELQIPYGKKKQLVEGKKKLKGISSSRKAAAAVTDESLRVSGPMASKYKTSSSYGGLTSKIGSTSKSNVRKLKPKNGPNKEQESYRDSSDKNLEKINNQVNLLEKSAGNRPRDSRLDNVGIKCNTYLNKSEEQVHGKTVGNQTVLGASLKYDLHVGNSLAKSEVASGVAPPIVEALDQDIWVCCDSCHKWRLLPFGTKPEQFPEKWLCSMLNWLPGMNRCDISQEETTKALNALYQLPVTESQNLYATGTGVASALTQHHDQNNDNLNSHAAFVGGKKKYAFKEMPKAGSNVTMHTSNSMKNPLLESVKSRSLNDMNQPPAEANLLKKSGSHQLSRSHIWSGEKHMSKQKEKLVNEGNSKQLKIKNKREAADRFGDGTSKKAKVRVMSPADNNQKNHVDIGKMGLESKAGLTLQKSGKNVPELKKCSFPDDLRHDPKERLLASVKKQSDQAQVSFDGEPLDLRMSDTVNNISATKRRLRDSQYQQDGYGNLYSREESGEIGFRKRTKSRASETEGKASSRNNCDDGLNRKGKLTPIHLSVTRGHPIHDTEEIRSSHKGQQIPKDGRKTSQQTLDGADFLRKDLGCGQVSIAAASSSSKVSGSHKSGANFEGMKDSPVESVSSSPLRTSHPHMLMSAAGDVSRKGEPIKVNRLKIGDVSRKGEPIKASSSFHPEALKFSLSDYQARGSSHKIISKAKSSEFKNNHLCNGEADNTDDQYYPSDLCAMPNSHDEDRGRSNYHENIPISGKSHKSSSSRLNGNNRNSEPPFDAKMKVSDSVGEAVIMCSKRSTRSEALVGLNRHILSDEAKNDVKHVASAKSDKDEENHHGRKDCAGQWPSGSRMVYSLDIDVYDDSNVNFDALSSEKGKVGPQKNFIKDERKADSVRIESRNGISELSSNSEGGGQQTRGSQLAPGFVQGEVHSRLPVDASGNGDVSKMLTQLGYVAIENGACNNPGDCMTDTHGVGVVTISNFGRSNISSHSANVAIKDARNLRDYADRLKSSGFSFESNEAYFQAALKFLHGASLLETCNKESSRHGEMNQMHVYSTSAKLCESCAHEYERRQEMAAAALAYKCMEVAYMRVVYCKHSSTIRDRSELQATLQMLPQGESPSSSASDVDNLNNQAIADKHSISKGTVSLVSGNHVVARSRPNFVRLLDFTQDVNFAMEASRKSQNAFAAASAEEAQNRECIASIRKVIDFSFQDVEALIRLVGLAMEAISRSSFGGARE